MPRVGEMYFENSNVLGQFKEEALVINATLKNVNSCNNVTGGFKCTTMQNCHYGIDVITVTTVNSCGNGFYVFIDTTMQIRDNVDGITVRTAVSHRCHNWFSYFYTFNCTKQPQLY